MSSTDEEGLKINYSINNTIFGYTLIASSNSGICYVAFGKPDFMIQELYSFFPKADISQSESKLHNIAINAIEGKEQKEALPLHLKGTDLQIIVWKELLKVPRGTTSNYSQIASEIGKPKATRAVATAIGKNPISYFIPCHRIVRKDDTLGGYHWGLEIKKLMLSNETKIHSKI
ncbi:MAG: methylated-DNA--[protein]-cysteine S-methyltransferase [Fermentimonas sp.]|jgi:AraC family transcriptional regulator of adaptative response/methylated-DNA-[protein]-cysteine methyltransferase